MASRPNTTVNTTIVRNGRTVIPRAPPSAIQKAATSTAPGRTRSAMSSIRCGLAGRPIIHVPARLSRRTPHLPGFRSRWRSANTNPFLEVRCRTRANGRLLRSHLDGSHPLCGLSPMKIKIRVSAPSTGLINLLTSPATNDGLLAAHSGIVPGEESRRGFDKLRCRASNASPAGFRDQQMAVSQCMLAHADCKASLAPYLLARGTLPGQSECGRLETSFPGSPSVREGDGR